MRRPRAAKLLAGLMDLAELKSRAELVHVLGCGDCYLYDSYDGGGGPHWCDPFLVEFRGYVPGPPLSGIIIPPLWSKMIASALHRSLVYGNELVDGGDHEENT